MPLLAVLTLQASIGLAMVPLIGCAAAAIILGCALIQLLVPKRGRAGTSPTKNSVLTRAEPESRDSLTGLPTFQPFSRRLLSEYEHVKGEGGEAAIILADISQLSRINEEFGVEVGDLALRHVGVCLTRVKRANDVIARAGDDEFAMVLPDCDLSGAEAFVIRAQAWLKERPIEVVKDGSDFNLWIGLCAGVAVCNQESSGTDALISAAIHSLGSERVERDRRQSRWTAAA
jgi:diguanylate cyclase (GGDEF)-like protein